MCIRDSYDTISKALANAKIATEESGIVQKPDVLVDVKDPNIARQVLGLVEKLEENDDIQAVYSNFDISDEVLEKAMAEQGK